MWVRLGPFVQFVVFASQSVEAGTLDVEPVDSHFTIVLALQSGLHDGRL